MTIENPTLSTAADLAHFRHFSHFRHSFNYNIFPIHSIMQNEANFPHFSSKNACLTQKRSQFEPNSNPNESNFGPISGGQSQNEPKQTQFVVSLSNLFKANLSKRLKMNTFTWVRSFTIVFVISSQNLDCRQTSLPPFGNSPFGVRNA
jgi:hypothetical protein